MSDTNGNQIVSGNLDAELNELLDEVEQSSLSRHKVKTRFFNQPSLLVVSSANANIHPQDTTQWNQQGFSSFTCAFERPALNIESIQLVSSNIPNATCSIPDTACVFWYYRLSQYSGMTPCLENLYMVRLLPSYYKPEFCGTYGQNGYFGNYSVLSIQLAKSCAKDLAANNLATLGVDAPNVYLPFMANDVSLTFNSTLNRFQFTGKASVPVLNEYSHDTTYALNAVVYSGSTNYISLAAANTANAPSTSPTWWAVYSGETIAPWSATIAYGSGRYVVYGTTLYISLRATINEEPDTSPTAWGTLTIPANFYNYLSTGPNDPNVQQAQAGPYFRQWNATHLYQTGDVVLYQNIWYFCLLQNTNLSPDSSATYWAYNAWDVGYTYANGDAVYYSPYYFVSRQDSNIAYTPVLPWDPTISYTPGRYVLYQYNLYRATLNTLGHIPANTTFWNAILGDGTAVATWNSGTSYTIGNYVWFGGVVYQAIANSTNNTPPNLTYWSVSPTMVWNPALPWTSGVSYNPLDYVFYNDAIWTPTAGVSSVPPRANPWIGNTDFTTNIRGWSGGLNYVSRLVDMLDYSLSTTGNYAFPFPADIPAQPYNPSPSRLLNSILGFCWNGVFDPTWVTLAIQASAGGSIVIGFTQASFFNRLRPVLPYIKGTPRTGLGSSNSPTGTLTYTADTYCNLLYSSVVSLYCDFLTSGTLDSQRTNNLIALSPMAAPLSLSSFNAYIDNPVLRVMEHIDQMTIELYDEFSEPYWLPLSAVVTLTFKVRYKE
jgi:hypothetical protein